MIFNLIVLIFQSINKSDLVINIGITSDYIGRLLNNQDQLKNRFLIKFIQTKKRKLVDCISYRLPNNKRHKYYREYPLYPDNIDNNTKLLIDIPYKDGKREGEANINIEYSNIKINYKNGLRHGTYIEYYDRYYPNIYQIYTKYYKNKIKNNVKIYKNNTIYCKINYIKGKPLGNFKEYYENGQIKINTNVLGYTPDINKKDRYSINKSLINVLKLINKNGKHIEYYETGEKKLVCYYQNDKLIGKIRYYYPDGTLKFKSYIKTPFNIKQPNSLFINKLLNHQLERKFIFNYENGNIYIKIDYNYRDILTNYHKYLINGDIIESAILTNNGIYKINETTAMCKCIFYIKNSSIKQYITGNKYYTERVGIFTRWKNNKLYQIQNYNNNGKLHGNWIEYYENGQIKEKYNYNNGKLHGKYLFYYENGQFKKRYYYKKGNLDKICIDYDITGEINRYRIIEKGRLKTDLRFKIF